MQPARQSGDTSAHRRLVLHVGMTKAGSTSIQNYLELSRQELALHQILFPATGFSRGNPFDPERTSGHLDLVKRIGRGDVQALEGELDRACPQVIVLSAENLLLDRPDGELESLARYFQAWEFTVVAVLRSQRAWLQSRYIESVVGGYGASTMTGDEFTDLATNKGWLDYHAAINRLCELLGTSRVSLVNYDDAARRGRLIEEFLKAAGLPVVDAELARTTNANVRDKGFDLVEVTRRLNYVLGSWPTERRLAFEASFREHLATRTESRRPTGSYVAEVCPFPQDTLKRAAAGNVKLVEQFGLTPPLTLLPGSEHLPRQHRWCSTGVDELTRSGFSIAAQLLQSVAAPVAKKDMGESSILRLRNSGYLLGLLASSHVSLHLGSPESALIAASYTERLVVFASLGGSKDVELDLLRARLPSEIVCLEHVGATGTKHESVAGVLEHRDVDLMVAQGSSAAEQVSKLVEQRICAGPVVLICQDWGQAAELVGRHGYRVVDAVEGCVVLSLESE